MTMKYNCFAYKEHITNGNVITPVCKVFISNPSIPCAVGDCKLFKTYAQYNHKRVEAQIAEYGRTHE